MNELKNYTGYEYKRITMDTSMESLWRDSMANFGWEVEKREAKIVKHLPLALWIMVAPLSLFPWRPFKKQLSNHASDTEVELTFKRNRKIAHKKELNQLEARFEHCARSIESMETTKEMTAIVLASAVGLLGTGCMAVSTFSYLAGMMPAFVIAAVLGFLGWIIPFFLYRHMKSAKEQDIMPKIEEQHESIYGICKSGSELLHAGN